MSEFEETPEDIEVAPAAVETPVPPLEPELEPEPEPEPEPEVTIPLPEGVSEDEVGLLMRRFGLSRREAISRVAPAEWERARRERVQSGAAERTEQIRELDVEGLMMTMQANLTAEAQGLPPVYDSAEAAFDAHAQNIGLSPDELRTRLGQAQIPLGPMLTGVVQGRPIGQVIGEAEARGASFTMPEREREIAVRGQILEMEARSLLEESPEEAAARGITEETFQGGIVALEDEGEFSMLGMELADDQLRRIVSQEGEIGYQIAADQVARLTAERPEIGDWVRELSVQQGGGQGYMSRRLNQMLEEWRAENPSLAGQEAEDQARAQFVETIVRELANFRTINWWMSPILISANYQYIRDHDDIGFMEAMAPQIEIVGLNNNGDAVTRVSGPGAYAFKVVDSLQSGIVGAIAYRGEGSFGQNFTRGMANQRDFLEYSQEVAGPDAHWSSKLAHGVWGTAGLLFTPDAFLGGAIAYKGATNAADMVRLGRVARRDIRDIDELLRLTRGGDVDSLTLDEIAALQAIDARLMRNPEIAAQMDTLDGAVGHFLGRENPHTGFVTSATEVNEGLDLSRRLPGNLGGQDINLHPTVRKARSRTASADDAAGAAARRGDEGADARRVVDEEPGVQIPDLYDYAGHLRRIRAMREASVGISMFAPTLDRIIVNPSRIIRNTIAEQTDSVIAGEFMTRLKNNLGDALERPGIPPKDAAPGSVSPSWYTDTVAEARRTLGIEKSADELIDEAVQAGASTDEINDLRRVLQARDEAMDLIERQLRAIAEKAKKIVDENPLEGADEALAQAERAIRSNLESRIASWYILHQQLQGALIVKGKRLRNPMAASLAEKIKEFTTLTPDAELFAGMLQRYMKLKFKDANAVARLFDARAKVWAAENNRNPHDWWSSRIEGIKSKEDFFKRFGGGGDGGTAPVRPGGSVDDPPPAPDAPPTDAPPRGSPAPTPTPTPNVDADAAAEIESLRSRRQEILDEYRVLIPNSFARRQAREYGTDIPDLDTLDSATLQSMFNANSVDEAIENITQFLAKDAEAKQISGRIDELNAQQARPDQPTSAVTATDRSAAAIDESIEIDLGTIEGRASTALPGGYRLTPVDPDDTGAAKKWTVLGPDGDVIAEASGADAILDVVEAAVTKLLDDGVMEYHPHTIRNADGTPKSPVRVGPVIHGMSEDAVTMALKDHPEEIAVMFIDGAQTYRKTSNSAISIAFSPEDLVDIQRTSFTGSVFVHNHPKLSWFSIADGDLSMAAIMGVRDYRVVLPDGDVLRLTAPNGWGDLGLVADLYRGDYGLTPPQEIVQRIIDATIPAFNRYRERILDAVENPTFFEIEELRARLSKQYPNPTAAQYEEGRRLQFEHWNTAGSERYRRLLKEEFGIDVEISLQERQVRTRRFRSQQPDNRRLVVVEEFAAITEQLGPQSMRSLKDAADDVAQGVLARGADGQPKAQKVDFINIDDVGMAPDSSAVTITNPGQITGIIDELNSLIDDLVGPEGMWDELEKNLRPGVRTLPDSTIALLRLPSDQRRNQLLLIAGSPPGTPKDVELASSLAYRYQPGGEGDYSRGIDILYQILSGLDGWRSGVDNIGQVRTTLTPKRLGDIYNRFFEITGVEGRGPRFVRELTPLRSVEGQSTVGILQERVVRDRGRVVEGIRVASESAAENIETIQSRFIDPLLRLSEDQAAMKAMIGSSGVVWDLARRIQTLVYEQELRRLGPDHPAVRIMADDVAMRFDSTEYRVRELTAQVEHYQRRLDVLNDLMRRMGEKSETLPPVIVDRMCSDIHTELRNIADELDSIVSGAFDALNVDRSKPLKTATDASATASIDVRGLLPPRVLDRMPEFAPGGTAPFASARTIYDKAKEVGISIPRLTDDILKHATDSPNGDIREYVNWVTFLALNHSESLPTVRSARGVLNRSYEIDQMRESYLSGGRAFRGFVEAEGARDRSGFLASILRARDTIQPYLPSRELEGTLSELDQVLRGTESLRASTFREWHRAAGLGRFVTPLQGGAYKHVTYVPLDGAYNTPLNSPALGLGERALEELSEIGVTSTTSVGDFLRRLNNDLTLQDELNPIVVDLLKRRAEEADVIRVATESEIWDMLARQVGDTVWFNATRGDFNVLDWSLDFSGAKYGNMLGPGIYLAENPEISIKHYSEGISTMSNLSENVQLAAVKVSPRQVLDIRAPLSTVVSQLESMGVDDLAVALRGDLNLQQKTARLDLMSHAERAPRLDRICEIILRDDVLSALPPATRREIEGALRYDKRNLDLDIVSRVAQDSTPYAKDIASGSVPSVLDNSLRAADRIETLVVDQLRLDTDFIAATYRVVGTELEDLLREQDIAMYLRDSLVKLSKRLGASPNNFFRYNRMSGADLFRIVGQHDVNVRRPATIFKTEIIDNITDVESLSPEFRRLLHKSGVSSRDDLIELFGDMDQAGEVSINAYRFAEGVLDHARKGTLDEIVDAGITPRAAHSLSAEDAALRNASFSVTETGQTAWTNPDFIERVLTTGGRTPSGSRRRDQVLKHLSRPQAVSRMTERLNHFGIESIDQLIEWTLQNIKLQDFDVNHFASLQDPASHVVGSTLTKLFGESLRQQEDLPGKIGRLGHSFLRDLVLHLATPEVNKLIANRNLSRQLTTNRIINAANEILSARTHRFPVQQILTNKNIDGLLHFGGKDSNVLVLFDPRGTTLDGATETLVQSGRVFPELKMYQGDSLEWGDSAARASVDFADDGRATIAALEEPDVQSVLRALGHILRRDMSSEDMNSVLRHVNRQLGLEGDEALRHEGNRFVGATGDIRTQAELDELVGKAEDIFAATFEDFIVRGAAPDSSLRVAGTRIKNLMGNIYASMTRGALNINIDPEVEAVFERMLAEVPTPTPPLRRVMGALQRTFNIAGPDKPLPAVNSLNYIQEEGRRLGATKVAYEVAGDPPRPTNLIDLTEENLSSIYDNLEEGQVLRVLDKDGNEVPILHDMFPGGKSTFTREELGRLQVRLENERSFALSETLPRPHARSAAHAVKELTPVEALASRLAQPGVKSALARGVMYTFFGGDPNKPLRLLPPMLRNEINAGGRIVEQAANETLRLISESNQYFDGGMSEVITYLTGGLVKFKFGGRSVMSSGWNSSASVSEMLKDTLTNLLDATHGEMRGTLLELFERSRIYEYDARVWTETMDQLRRNDPDLYELQREALDRLFRKKGSSFLSDVGNIIGLTGQARPQDYRMMEALMYFSGESKRNGRLITEAFEGADDMWALRTKQLLDDVTQIYGAQGETVAKKLAMIISGHGHTRRAIREWTDMGISVSEDVAGAFKRWRQGEAIPDHLRAEVMATVRRYGYNPFFLDDPLVEAGQHIPLQARKRLSEAVARSLERVDPRLEMWEKLGNTDRALNELLGSEMSMQTMFGTVFRYMKLRMTRGAVMIRPRYFLMNTIDHFNQMAMTTGFRPAIVSALRMSSQNLLALPGVNKALGIIELATNSRLNPTEYRFQIEQARKLLQAGGDTVANLAGRMMGIGKYNLRLNDILEGRSGTLKVTSKDGRVKIYSYQDIREIMVQEGIFASFDTSALGKVIRQNATRQWAGVTGKLKSVSQDILFNAVDDIAEAWAERERAGAVLTLINAGYDPKTACRVTIDALFDYAGTMTKFDRHWLMSMLFPFLAYQKNANRQIFNLMFSPRGAYRMGVIRRANEGIPRLISEVYWSMIVDPYGVNYDVLTDQEKAVYDALRMRIELGYGPIEDLSLAQRERLERAFGVEDLSTLSDEQKQIIERGYGPPSEQPPVVRTALMRLFAGTGTANHTRVMDGRILDMTEFMELYSGYRGLQADELVEGSADAEAFRLALKAAVMPRPEAHELPSYYRDRAFFPIPTKLDENTQEYFRLLEQSGYEAPWTGLFLPENTMQGGMNHLAGMAAFYVLGTDYLLGISDESEGAEMLKYAMENALDEVVEPERAPILGNVLDAISDEQMQYPRRISNTSAAMIRSNPAMNMIPVLTIEEVRDWYTEDEKSQALMEGIMVAEEMAETGPTVRPQRNYIPPGWMTMAWDNSPMGEFDRLMKMFERTPLEETQELQGRMQAWARGFVGADIQEITGSRTAILEEPYTLRQRRGEPETP